MMSDSKTVPVTYGFNYDRIIGRLELTAEAIEALETGYTFVFSPELKLTRSGRELIGVNISPVSTKPLAVKRRRRRPDATS